MWIEWFTSLELFEPPELATNQDRPLPIVRFLSLCAVQTELGLEPVAASHTPTGPDRHRAETQMRGNVFLVVCSVKNGELILVVSYK